LEVVIVFTKYLNKFKKAEAEWVHEVLDMHGGDYEQAKQAVIGALNRLSKKAAPIAELKDFDDTIAGCFFASRYWWAIGMRRLAELGLVTLPPVTSA
jgi:hypothetical protein